MSCNARTDWNRETPRYKTADSQVTDAFTVLARIVGFFGAENVFLVRYVDSDQKKREVCEWLHESVDVCHKYKNRRKIFTLLPNTGAQTLKELKRNN